MTASSVPPPSSPTQKPTSPRERDQKLVAQIDANLGERLRAERADPVWASETQAAIASTLASPSFAGLRLDAVSCGATLCRVALVAGEQVADVDAAVEELTSMDPFRHGGFLRFTGARALTMFVARKGHPLPPPPRT